MTVGIPINNPTKYVGPDVAIVSIVSRNRSPTGADIRQGTTGRYYPLGSLWIVSNDPTTGTQGDMWWLSKIVANVAFWLQIGAGGTPLLEIETPNGDAVPLAGVIQFLQAGGITISAAGNAVSFNVTGMGLNWSEVTTTSQAMAADSGYVANNVGLVTLTLPAIAPQFSVVSVVGKGSGGWTIAQNAAQTIYYGNATTTPGVGGSLSSALQRDCVTLMCITANNEWEVMQGPQGNITYI